MSVTLTLRVSRDKRRPGVKTKTVKEEKIKEIIEKIKLFSSGSTNFLKYFENASSLRFRLEIIKRAFSDSKGYFHGEKVDLKIPVEIFLSLELKSPLRSGIVRIFQKGKHCCPALVQKLIADALRERFLSADQRVTTTREVASTLGGCFDNFPLGVEAVRLCQLEAYDFILSGLTLCYNHISGNVDSAEPEVCQCTHELVRAALHVCGLLQSASETVTELHQLARQLFTCDWLPLDTRTNCGLLAVTSGVSHWRQMLQEQLSSLDDLSSLCLYSGLLSCLSVHQLSDKLAQEDKSAVLLIFDSIMDIQQRNPLQAVMTLGVARTLVSLSRLILSDSTPLPLLLPRLLLYIWEHLEHVMDSVKHLASTLLQNIVKMHSSAVDVHGAVIAAMRELPVWGRARHIALSTLIGKLPVSVLIQDKAEVSRFYHHLEREVISSHAINVVQDLMKQYYQEVNDQVLWREWWVDPLVFHLNRNACVPLQQVLTTALSLAPSVIKHIISYPEELLSLSARLLILRQAHKLDLLHRLSDDEVISAGSEEPSSDDMLHNQHLRPDEMEILPWIEFTYTLSGGSTWMGVISYDMLYSALHHADEQIQLSCLALIVEGPRPSSMFTKDELCLVQKHVQLNLNMETAACRQRNIALLSKFVSRLNASQKGLEHWKPAYSLWLCYKECRQLLANYCLDSLFPGATYSRRITALHLLSILNLHLPSTLTDTSFTSIMACLADSYEDVKQMAFRLLASTDRLLLRFLRLQPLMRCLELGVTQAGGVKPPECLTAAYLLATVAQYPPTPAILSALTNHFPRSVPYMGDAIKDEMTFLCLKIVLDHLTFQLYVAEVDLLLAARTSPMYGLLFSARLLLSQIDLSECSCQDWSILIKDLVGVSISCSKAVESVVNSDSPEGHLPMDFTYDLRGLAGFEAEGDAAAAGVTSQMVLLCSWRTVKEVSLLLGFLVQSASIALTPTDEGLFGCEEVYKIRDHLTNLLAQTKHRGAFEQAYVGFCQLVSRLWSLPQGKLRDVPRQLLAETMSEISGGAQNMCATRRSAGVPFMIQALICTQLEAEGPAAIEPWVQRLLDMADDLASTTTTRTHTLNILRALFRNTQLGEAVTVFVERAFMITIAAFSSTSWMERNSATLLLSALMTRVFGVPRTKNQEYLCWKNKMTGRIFFQRYPKLFGFFRDELQKASSCLSGNLHPSLYPVLLVLGRLYPSSLEGSDSNIQLAEFIPDLMLCAGSSIYKTRTLAASAMVALMTQQHLDILVTRVSQTTMPANLRHGLLLQILYFLKQSYFVSLDHAEPKNGNWIEKLKDIFSTKLCFAELEVVFSIYDVLCQRCFDQVPKYSWCQVTGWAQHYLKASKTGKLNVFCAMRTQICKLLLKLFTMTDGEGLEDLCIDLLSDNMYEVRHTVLNFISCLHSDTNCSQSFCKFFKDVCSVEARNRCQTRISLILDTFVNCFLTTCFAQEGKVEASPEDKAKFLMTLMNWKEALAKILEAKDTYSELNNLSFIVDLCKDPHEAVAHNALHCLSQFIGLKGILDEEEVSGICEVLVRLCKPETCGVFEETVLNLLQKHFNVLQQSARPVNRLMMYKCYIELTNSKEWPVAVDRVCESESDIAVVAALLTALTLGKFVTTQENVGEASPVFEQSGLNENYEEVLLSRICGSQLRILWSPNLSTLLLDQSIVNWLTAQTGLRGNTLAELTALAKMHGLQLGTEVWQFMTQGYLQQRVNCLKLNNFL